jgi:3-deoxy-7-phosphoheptulonate synthase
MLESNLFDGQQSLEVGRDNLRYGVSITDACLNWETTEELIRQSRDRMKTR